MLSLLRSDRELMQEVPEMVLIQHLEENRSKWLKYGLLLFQQVAPFDEKKFLEDHIAFIKRKFQVRDVLIKYAEDVQWPLKPRIKIIEG